MSSAPLFPDFTPAAKPRRRPRLQMVRSLLRLNEAVQQISSILDLDVLLDTLVNEIVGSFGCQEAAVLLKEGDSDEVCVAAVTGCSQCHKRDRFRIAVDGLVGWVAGTGQALYVPDVTREPRYIACEPQTRSEFDIPLIANSEVIGVFSAQHPEVDGFSPEQRALLEALAKHLAVAVQNARLFRRERQEKSEARSIQQALFPKAPPQVPGFIIEGHCVPAGDVGGDWYDFLPLNGRRVRRQLWGLVLADVSGKGMPAALLMSATRALLRATAEKVTSPAAALTQLNRTLLRDLPPEKFVTMIYAVLDPLKRTLTFANAGHPWPILVKGGGAELLTTASGLPLGLTDTAYQEAHITLAAGSRLLFYSDGVTEAGLDNGPEYGLERLRQHAVEANLSPDHVLQEVTAFCAGGPLNDDATLITVQSG